MRRSVAAALTAILLASTAVRLSPLWSFLYWGSDTGEYFAITRGLLRTGHVSTTYYGWGITYPYFPGMFFLHAGLVPIGGLDLPTALSLLVPILGAFSVLPLFLVAARVSGDPRIALFAAAFLAGAIPHVYTTAHAAPATLGDLFALTGLLLFVRLRDDGRSALPLLLVTGALIATHHLSAYFFVLLVLGTIIVRGIVRPWRWTAGSKREVAFAGALLAGTFGYWFVYATAFRDSILPDVSIRPWWALLVGFATGLVLLAALVRARTHVHWRYRPRYPGLRYRGATYGAAVGTIGVIGLVSVLSGVPGTTFRVPAQDLLYFLPFSLLICWAAVGRKFSDFLRDGITLTTWIVALVGSAVVGIIAAPRVLIPYRHMEYLVVPFAVLAGVGVVRCIDLARPGGGMRTAVAVVAASLLVANALAGIPPATALAGWREGTLPTALDVAYWARDHADGLVVTDHHASSIVFGFGGLNATWDRAIDPFVTNDPGNPLAGLQGIPSPSGTMDGSYVWIDRDMEAGLRLRPWDPAAPMDLAVLAKFDRPPFLKVFDNGYARIYWIAWTCDTSC